MMTVRVSFGMKPDGSKLKEAFETFAGSKVLKQDLHTVIACGTHFCQAIFSLQKDDEPEQTREGIRVGHQYCYKGRYNHYHRGSDQSEKACKYDD